MLFYGDPLIRSEHGESGGICMLCKKYCADEAKLEAHIASADHCEKVAAALADGCLTKPPEPEAAHAQIWRAVEKAFKLAVERIVTCGGCIQPEPAATLRIMVAADSDGEFRLSI